MPANPKPDSAGTRNQRSTAPTHPTVPYRRLIVAIALSLLPLLPLWFSGVTCFAYRDATHVRVWTLQQAHGRRLHFHAEQGEFTYSTHKLQQNLYWVSPHVTFAFAATSPDTMLSESLSSLATKLEALRQNQSVWALHLHPLHGLAFALFIIAVIVWLRLWRDTKHRQ